MDTIALRYFLKLIEVCNFSQAADELFITQPTLSQQISKLEKELDVKLINRTTRSFELTDAGKAFAEYAEKIVNTEYEMKSQMEQFSVSTKKTLRIGVIPTLGKMHQTENVLSFGKKYPDLNIEVYEEFSENLYKLMAKGRLDIAIANHIEKINIGKGALLESIPFMMGRTVVVCNKTHRFATMRSVSLEDAVEEPIIKLNRRSSIFNEMNREFRKHHLTPKYACECATTSNMISLVDAGYGISFLSDNIASSYATEKTCIVKISPKIPHTTVILTQKDNREKEIIKDFIHHMSQYAQL